MEPADQVADYPIALLADILDRVVDDAVMAALEAEGHDDLTHAQGVVFEMLEPGGSRVTDMARAARMTKQGMGQLVDAVAAAGYVERSPDPNDGRAQLVRLTPRGERAVAIGGRGLRQLERSWSECLGHRRYEATRRTLVELVRATGLGHVR